MPGVLGVVLAGGRSTRFGSDKAVAMIAGRPLIEHALASLVLECDQVVVAGRRWRSFPMVTDHPRAGHGPLGGLCAALRYARANGIDAVLTAPVDVWPLPKDLVPSLETSPAVLADQWTVGLWPATLADPLLAHIEAGHRSMRSWIEAAGARVVTLDGWNPRNLNEATELPVAQRCTGSPDLFR